MPMLEPAVMTAVGKIKDEIFRFHSADRVYVLRALLFDKELTQLVAKAQQAGPYPYAPGGPSE